MSDNMPHSHMTVKHDESDYAHSVLVAHPAKAEYGGMENLKRIRKDRGLTQVQLAEAAGCNQATISKMEKGDKNATLDMVERIAKVLKVEPWELFGIDDLRQRYLDALSRASEDKKRAVLLLLEGDQERRQG